VYLLKHTQVIADAFNQTVTRASFKRIQGLSWLNDEVINMYMQVERRKLLYNSV
jgi:Ulp1 family protease